MFPCSRSVSESTPGPAFCSLGAHYGLSSASVFYYLQLERIAAISATRSFSGVLLRQYLDHWTYPLGRGRGVRHAGVYGIECRNCSIREVCFDRVVEHCRLVLHSWWRIRVSLDWRYVFLSRVCHCGCIIGNSGVWYILMREICTAYSQTNLFCEVEWYPYRTEVQRIRACGTRERLATEQFLTIIFPQDLIARQQVLHAYAIGYPCTPP